MKIVASRHEVEANNATHVREIEDTDGAGTLGNAGPGATRPRLAQFLGTNSEEFGRVRIWTICEESSEFRIWSMEKNLILRIRNSF